MLCVWLLWRTTQKLLLVLLVGLRGSNRISPLWQAGTRLVSNLFPSSIQINGSNNLEVPYGLRLGFLWGKGLLQEPPQEVWSQGTGQRTFSGGSSVGWLLIYPLWVGLVFKLWGVREGEWWGFFSPGSDRYILKSLFFFFYVLLAITGKGGYKYFE